MKLMTDLDRSRGGRVPLQPDDFGFLVDDTFLAGSSLGRTNETTRNLPYLAAGS